MTEKEKFFYVLGLLLIGFLQMFFEPTPGFRESFFDLDPFKWVPHLILLGGTLFCFRYNQNGDGRNFIDRLICLSFPIQLWKFLIILGCVSGHFLLKKFGFIYFYRAILRDFYQEVPWVAEGAITLLCQVVLIRFIHRTAKPIIPEVVDGL